MPCTDTRARIDQNKRQVFKHSQMFLAFPTNRCWRPKCPPFVGARTSSFPRIWNESAALMVFLLRIATLRKRSGSTGASASSGATRGYCQRWSKSGKYVSCFMRWAHYSLCTNSLRIQPSPNRNHPMGDGCVCRLLHKDFPLGFLASSGAARMNLGKSW